MTKRRKHKGKKHHRRLGGPERKLEVVRLPSGRISEAGRSRDCGPTLESIAQRKRLLGKDDDRIAGSQNAGSLIGRWYETHRLGRLDGKEEKGKRDAERALALKNAGEKFWRCCENYERMLLAPAQPSAVDPNRAHGSALPDYVDYARRFGQLAGQYRESYDVLVDCGLDVLRAVRDVLQEREASDALVVQGLEALDGADRRITRAALDEAKRRADMAKAEMATAMQRCA